MIKKPKNGSGMKEAKRMEEGGRREWEERTSGHGQA
jgi:hypothetical protein